MYTYPSTSHKHEPDSQCTYKVTPKRVCVTNVAVEKHIECVCVSVCVRVSETLSIQHEKAHAPYYTGMCGLSGCTIFVAHYLTKGTYSGGEELCNIKNVF
jgi:hypothetical protein